MNMWDRIEAHDSDEAWVDRLCAFINPEGYRSLDTQRKEDVAKEIGDDAIVSVLQPSGPKPKSAYPEHILKMFKESPNRPAILDENEFDEIIPPEFKVETD